MARVAGPAGEGYIECHHAIPLSEVAGPTVTKLNDLILLCANCHRIVHRRRPWLTAQEIKTVLSAAKSISVKV